MTVILIEDNAQKADRIAAFLSDKLGIEISEICRSYQSGLKAAERLMPDLILLDMTLPTFDVAPRKREGRPRTQGGRELMRKLAKKGVNSKVVIVTQYSSFSGIEGTLSYSELVSVCKSEFPESFLGSVYYHPTSNDWELEIMELLQGETK